MTDRRFATLALAAALAAGHAGPGMAQGAPTPLVPPGSEGPSPSPMPPPQTGPGAQPGPDEEQAPPDQTQPDQTQPDEAPLDQEAPPGQPLPPPPGTAPQTPPAGQAAPPAPGTTPETTPGTTTTPASPAPSPGAPASPAEGQAAPSPAPAAPPPPVQLHLAWVPQQTAQLRALNKIDDRSELLTVKVGTTATFDHLTIAVQACMTHPPDQPPDAASYLQITDPRPGASGFAGWVLKNEPWVSMLQDPVYDVRVIGCS